MALASSVKTEAQVRDPVVRWAKAHGFMHIRLSFTRGARAGWPDDLFITPRGKSIFFEFKRPGRKPTKLQMLRLRELWQQGCTAEWSDDSAATIKHLEYLQQNT